MLTQRIVAGFILAGLAGAAMAMASDAKAQSGKLRLCQEECAGNPACLRTCGGSIEGAKKKLIPPRPEPEPPAVKSWQDEVFARGKDGGGGGAGGGSGR